MAHHQLIAALEDFDSLEVSSKGKIKAAKGGPCLEDLVAYIDMLLMRMTSNTQQTHTLICLHPKLLGMTSHLFDSM